MFRYNLGLETCGIVSRVGGGDELLGSGQCADDLQHEALGGVDDGTFSTEVALGDFVAAVVPSCVHREQHERHVRFNPIIEVVEFEKDFDFMVVDDVFPSGSLSTGCLECHFTSEVAPGTSLPVEIDEELDAPLDEIEEDDDPYVIIHGFEGLEISTRGAAISDLEPMQVITYGIRGRSLGRRDTWVTSSELPQLRQAIWELWEDSIPQFAACWAFAVRPQPFTRTSSYQGLDPGG